MAELSTLGGVIKTAYEGEDNTNPFTDAEKIKLSDIAWATLAGKPATFTPTIGTTAATAKAGNYQPTYAQVTGKPATFPPTIGVTAETAMAGNTPIPAAATWATLAGKPSTFAPIIGTTASTAMAGNTAIPPAYTLPAAGAALGGVLKGSAVADSVAGGELAAINALLASLRAAGVIA